MSPPTARSRTIFVAYPYAFPERDYRRPFQTIEKAFDVKFDYGDRRRYARCDDHEQQS